MTSLKPESRDLGQESAKIDIDLITDEDHLRKLWQSTEDFAEKRRIRTRMYKLREQRLKEFYTSNDVVEVPASNSATMSSTSKMEMEYSFSSTEGQLEAGTDGQMDEHSHKRRNVHDKDSISDKIRRKDEERSQRYHNLMNEVETTATSAAYSAVSQSFQSSSSSFVTVDSTRVEDLGYDSMQMESGAMSNTEKVLTGNLADGNSLSTNLDDDDDVLTKRTNAEKPVSKATKSRKISTEKDSPTRKLSTDTKKENPARKKSEPRKNSTGVQNEDLKNAGTTSASRKKSKDLSSAPKKTSERKSISEKLEPDGRSVAKSQTASNYREEKIHTSRRETTDGKTTTIVETTEFIRHANQLGDVAMPRPLTKERVTISKTTIIDSNGKILDENEDEVIEELPYDAPVMDMAFPALSSALVDTLSSGYREESRRLSQRETSDGKTRTEIEVIETIRRNIKRNELEKVTVTKTTQYDMNGVVLNTKEDEAVEVVDDTNSPPCSMEIESTSNSYSVDLSAPEIATRLNILYRPLVCVLSNTSDYLEEQRKVSRKETGDNQGTTIIEITEVVRLYRNPTAGQPRRIKVIITRTTTLNSDGSIVDEKEEETSEAVPDGPEDEQPIVTVKSKTPARKASKKITRGRKTSDIRPLLATSVDFIEEERQVTRKETSDGKLTKIVLITIILRRHKNVLPGQTLPKRERLTITKTTIMDTKGHTIEEDENENIEEINDVPVEEGVTVIKEPFKVGPKGDQPDGCQKSHREPQHEAKIQPVDQAQLHALSAALEDNIIPNVEGTITPKKAFKVADTKPTSNIDDGLLDPQPGPVSRSPSSKPTPKQPSSVEISEVDIDDDIIPDSTVERRYSVLTPELRRSPNLSPRPPRMEIEEMKPSDEELPSQDAPKKKTLSPEPVAKQPKKKNEDSTGLPEPKKTDRAETSRIPASKDTTGSIPRRSKTGEVKPKSTTREAEPSKPIKSQIPPPKTKSPSKPSDALPSADSPDSPSVANPSPSKVRGRPSDNEVRNNSPQRKAATPRQSAPSNEPKETDEPKKRLPNTRDSNTTGSRPTRPVNLDINSASAPVQKTPIPSPDRPSPSKTRQPIGDKDTRSVSPQRRCCMRHSGGTPVASPTATSPTRSKIPRSESPLKKPDLSDSPVLKHLDTDSRPESPSRSKYGSPTPKSDQASPVKTTKTSAAPSSPKKTGIPTRTESPKPKGVNGSIIANLPEELRNRQIMTKTVEYTKVYRLRDDDKPWRMNAKPAEPKKDLHQNVMQVVEKFMDCENCEVHGPKKTCKEPKSKVQERTKKDDGKLPSKASQPSGGAEKAKRGDKRDSPAREALVKKQDSLDDEIDSDVEIVSQPNHPDEDAELMEPKRSKSPESIDEDYIPRKLDSPTSENLTTPQKHSDHSPDREHPTEPKDHRFRPVTPSDDEEEFTRERSQSPPKTIQPEPLAKLSGPSSPRKDSDTRQCPPANPALDSPSAVIKAIKSTLDSPTSRRSPEKDVQPKPKSKSPEKDDVHVATKPSISQIRHGYETRKDDAPVRPVRKSSLKKTEEPNKINRIRNTFEKPESPSPTKEPKDSTTRRTPSQPSKKPIEDAPCTAEETPLSKVHEPTSSVIEEIEDVPWLEQMLDTATNYDDRSRIRAQIRIVKKKQGSTPSKTPSGSSSPMIGRRSMPATPNTTLERPKKSVSKPSDRDDFAPNGPVNTPSEPNEPEGEAKPARQTSAYKEPVLPTRKSSSPDRKLSSPSKYPDKDKPTKPSDRKFSNTEPVDRQPIEAYQEPEAGSQLQEEAPVHEVPWRSSPDREAPRRSPVKEALGTTPVRDDAPREQIAPWRMSPSKEIPLQPLRASPEKETPKPSEESSVPWRKISSTQPQGTPEQERPSSRPVLSSQVSQAKLRTPTHLPEDDICQPPPDLQDITSSYGTGPTDENGFPLFGLGALRRKPKTSDSKPPTDYLGLSPSERPKEPNEQGPTDSSGRPLFGLRAIVATPDNEGAPKSSDEDFVPARSQNLHAIIRKHEDAVDKVESPKSPALKPKSKLRDSFIRPAEDEVDERPRSPVPDKTIADRSQTLKQIIQKHQQAVETATVTKTSVIDEEKSIHDRSQPLKDIIQRHETFSNVGEPTLTSPPVPVVKRPGILKKPKESTSPQEIPSPTKEDFYSIPREISPTRQVYSREPSPAKQVLPEPAENALRASPERQRPSSLFRAPTDNSVGQPQPVQQPREPEVRKTSISYFSSTTTSVRRSVTPEPPVYVTQTSAVLSSPTVPTQKLPTQDSIPSTESPKTRGIPIEGRPYRGSAKETPKWPPTKDKETADVPRRPSQVSSATVVLSGPEPARCWPATRQNEPAEEVQPERRTSQVSYIEIPLTRPTPEPVTKRPSQHELIPEDSPNRPREPAQQPRPSPSTITWRGRFEPPKEDMPEKPTTTSAPWRNSQPTPEAERRPTPSSTAPWRRPRDEPVADSSPSQPRTSTATAPLLQPMPETEPFTSTITVPLRRPSQQARESPERRTSVTQTSYTSAATVVSTTTFGSNRVSVSPERQAPRDSNPPRSGRLSNASQELLEPQQPYTSSTTMPQRQLSDATTSSNMPPRKSSQSSELRNIALTGETVGHAVKSVSTFQLQLGSSPAPVQAPATQPDSTSTAPWRRQSQEQSHSPRPQQYPESSPSPAHSLHYPEENQYTPSAPTTTSTPSSSRKPSIDSGSRPNVRSGAGGSIRALAQKFLDNGDNSSPKAAYPRAGLIFRSSSFRQGQQLAAEPDGQGLQRSSSMRVPNRTPDRRSQDRQSPEKTTPLHQSTSLEVNIGTPTNISKPCRSILEPADEKVEQNLTESRKTSVTSVTLMPVNNMANGSPYPKSANARSFLEDHTPVQGLNDIMDRMRAAEPAQPGDQDAEARSLLNKFLGAQVIVQSMDPWATQHLGETPLTESIIRTSVNVSDDGKSLSRTVAAAQKGASSNSSSGVDPQGRQWTTSSATNAATFKSHTVTQAMGEPCTIDGIDINSCDDDFKLNELLDNCDDYETRRKIRSRIKQILAEQQGEGFSPSVAEGKSDLSRSSSSSSSSSTTTTTSASSFHSTGGFPNAFTTGAEPGATVTLFPAADETNLNNGCHLSALELDSERTNDSKESWFDSGTESGEDRTPPPSQHPCEELTSFMEGLKVSLEQAASTTTTTTAATREPTHSACRPPPATNPNNPQTRVVDTDFISHVDTILGTLKLSLQSTGFSPCVASNPTPSSSSRDSSQGKQNDDSSHQILQDFIASGGLHGTQPWNVESAQREELVGLINRLQASLKQVVQEPTQPTTNNTNNIPHKEAEPSSSASQVVTPTTSVAADAFTAHITSKRSFSNERPFLFQSNVPKPVVRPVWCKNSSNTPLKLEGTGPRQLVEKPGARGKFIVPDLNTVPLPTPKTPEHKASPVWSPKPFLKAFKSIESDSQTPPMSPSTSITPSDSTTNITTASLTFQVNVNQAKGITLKVGELKSENAKKAANAALPPAIVANDPALCVTRGNDEDKGTHFSHAMEPMERPPLEDIVRRNKEAKSMPWKVKLAKKKQERSLTLGNEGNATGAFDLRKSLQSAASRRSEEDLRLLKEVTGGHVAPSFDYQLGRVSLLEAQDAIQPQPKTPAPVITHHFPLFKQKSLGDLYIPSPKPFVQVNPNTSTERLPRSLSGPVDFQVPLARIPSCEDGAMQDDSHQDVYSSEKIITLEMTLPIVGQLTEIQFKPESTPPTMSSVEDDFEDAAEAEVVNATKQIPCPEPDATQIATPPVDRRSGRAPLRRQIAVETNAPKTTMRKSATAARMSDPSTSLFTEVESVQIAIHKAAINKQLSLEEARRKSSDALSPPILDLKPLILPASATVKPNDNVATEIETVKAREISPSKKHPVTVPMAQTNYVSQEKQGDLAPKDGTLSTTVHTTDQLSEVANTTDQDNSQAVPPASKEPEPRKQLKYRRREDTRVATRRANTIAIPRNYKEISADFGIPSAKLAPAFVPKTEFDRKFQSFLTQHNNSPTTPTYRNPSVSMWTNKFSNLKGTFETKSHETEERNRRLSGSLQENNATTANSQSAAFPIPQSTPRPNALFAKLPAEPIATQPAVQHKSDSQPEETIFMARKNLDLSIQAAKPKIAVVAAPVRKAVGPAPVQILKSDPISPSLIAETATKLEATKPSQPICLTQKPVPNWPHQPQTSYTSVSTKPVMIAPLKTPGPGIHVIVDKNTGSVVVQPKQVQLISSNSETNVPASPPQKVCVQVRPYNFQGPENQQIPSKKIALPQSAPDESRTFKPIAPPKSQTTPSTARPSSLVIQPTAQKVPELKNTSVMTSVSKKPAPDKLAAVKVQAPAPPKVIPSEIPTISQPAKTATMPPASAGPKPSPTKTPPTRPRSLAVKDLGRSLSSARSGSTDSRDDRDAHLGDDEASSELSDLDDDDPQPSPHKPLGLPAKGTAIQNLSKILHKFSSLDEDLPNASTAPVPIPTSCRSPTISRSASGIIERPKHDELTVGYSISRTASASNAMDMRRTQIPISGPAPFLVPERSTSKPYIPGDTLTGIAASSSFHRLPPPESEDSSPLSRSASNSRIHQRIANLEQEISKLKRPASPPKSSAGEDGGTPPRRRPQSLVMPSPVDGSSSLGPPVLTTDGVVRDKLSPRARPMSSSFTQFKQQFPPKQYEASMSPESAEKKQQEVLAFFANSSNATLQSSPNAIKKSASSTVLTTNSSTFVTNRSSSSSFHSQQSSQNSTQALSSQHTFAKVTHQKQPTPSLHTTNPTAAPKPPLRLLSQISFEGDMDFSDIEDAFEKILADVDQIPSLASGNITRRTSNTVTSQNEVITQKSSFSSSSFRSTNKGPGNSAFAKFQQLDQSAAKTPRLGGKGGQFARFSSVTSSTSGTNVVRSASDVKDLLLKWCQARTRGYQNVAIENFSSSWSNGLAFCALIHHFYPDAFDYSQLKPENRRFNFDLAFRVAEEKANIAPLLDVEDMVFMARPDWKCVFTYVQSIYRRLKDE